jgi:hypothetical protein
MSDSNWNSVEYWSSSFDSELPSLLQKVWYVIVSCFESALKVLAFQSVPPVNPKMRENRVPKRREHIRYQ